MAYSTSMMRSASVSTPASGTWTHVEHVERARARPDRRAGAEPQQASEGTSGGGSGWF